MSAWEFVFKAFLLVAFLACYISSLRWVMSDAAARGKDGITTAILIGLFAWPFGILLWIVLRPPLKERDAFAITVGGSPRCPCGHCGKLITRSWRACPHCAHPC